MKTLATKFVLSALSESGDVNRSSTTPVFSKVTNMWIQTFFATVILILPAISVAAADGGAADEQASWISFAEMPIRSNAEQKVHVRATKNVAPKNLKIVSSFVYRTTDLPMSLESYSDADLLFRTDFFLVTRFAGKQLTVATGARYPEASKRLLAKRFESMGFDVEFVPPQRLLRRNETSDSTAPEFIVPFTRASAE